MTKISGVFKAIFVCSNPDKCVQGIKTGKELSIKNQNIVSTGCIIQKCNFAKIDTYEVVSIMSQEN